MQDGFEALYRAQHAAVRRFVTRRLGEADGDDVVATTFELAYRKLPDHHPHPVGWLFRTAGNLVKAELRRRGREIRAVQDAATLTAIGGEDADVGILLGILSALPTAQRDVLQLTYWDGLAAAEVGVALGCSEQAVWKRISRAKAAIRAAWPADADADTRTWEEVMSRA